MFAVYNFLLPIVLLGARLAALFQPKIRRGLAGRQKLLEEVSAYYVTAVIRGPRILIHAASYGELEQAKPVISAIKEQYPSAHIHLTFFSPSGYENVVGKYREADFVSYAPLDTRFEVNHFLDFVKPDLALFTRYDVWPNMALELKRRSIPAILFTATAAEAFFRNLPIIRNSYRAIFRSLTKILAVSERDKIRFEAMGVEPAAIRVTGDTRFDQVLARREELEEAGDHSIPEQIRKRLIERGTLVFVVGSSWPEDEAVFLKTILESVERKDNIVTILVPHEPSEAHISKLERALPGWSIRFSKIKNWAGEQVIIVDSMGNLFGMYRYADISFIGGGFGDGLHNILEAAVWGIPSIIGPKHGKSGEVDALIDRISAFEVKNISEFHFVFWRLAESEDLRSSAGREAKEFVEEN